MASCGRGGLTRKKHKTEERRFEAALRAGAVGRLPHGPRVEAVRSELQFESEENAGP